MRREIGLWSVLAINIGLIIGSGIFITPAAVLQQAGSPALSLLMWLLPAGLSLLVGLCFLELFSAMPVSGGEYKYYFELYGPLAGFLSAWTFNLQLFTVYRAILSLTITRYLLAPLYPDCSPPASAEVFLSLTILLVLTAFNALYIKTVTRLQTVFSVLKIFTLGVIVITGCVRLAQGHTETLEIGFEGSNTAPGAIALSIQVGIFIYIGWNSIFNVIEEVKNPQRNVPLGMFISLFFIAGLYVMTNVAYFTVLSPLEMLQSPAVVMTFASKCFGPFAIVAPICVALTVVGSLNATMLTSSRLIFAAARDGLLPGVMSTIHVHYRTPWVALFAQSIIAAVYICIGDLTQLIEAQGFVFTIVFTTLSLSVLYVRSGRTKFKSTIRIPIFIPILSSALNLGLYIMGAYQNPRGNFVSTGLILLGIPFYYVFIVWRRYYPTLDRYIDAATIGIQKVFMVAPTDSTKQ
ncbi:hypothetical protein CAPTEDRAFT_153744 [Capitella teleta]|uniref:Amino acid permease/ SLC12A domain-containing protein n=1 Tax=Capitella teleta TaxID=283909 RepID=R7TH35_CAPTE|nr:hypothetical protein CAPTEDRAFT_153744 [Capitella teleta]|eukprot:ELT93123.1 hypothetical protein CAPTEDRAFT_153744 [Capitella teleta]